MKIQKRQQSIQKNSDSELVAVDLENALLNTMGNVVHNFVKAFASKDVTIEIGDQKIKIMRPEQYSDADGWARLKLMVKSARVLSVQSGVTYSSLLAHMLVTDGWSWNRHVFRSPVWMDNHIEIQVQQARNVEGLEWLVGSSSEIKQSANTV